jgi:photosystem II stability/assembly factor-like uncharacterized protein
MNKLSTLIALLCLPCLIAAQLTQPPFTPATERIESYKKRKMLLERSLVANVPFKNIGPTVFSGRVTDVDVWQQDPSHFYVAYASGGLWKTENNGQSFTPLFDNEMVMTIGDIAVDWQRNVVWIGTGEVNSSRSSYAGVGMYKSSDGGKTWQYKGLGESHHIGRVVLHPGDPNTVWVAVLGHLYSPNAERGVYKTTDGGNTWKRTLFVDGNSGAIDLVIDPDMPNTLYAATWQRERHAWNFSEAGKGSGIYKSEDGGETWKLLTTNGCGFPTGEGTGRIGLAVGKSRGRTALYAIVDNQNRRPPEEDEEEKLTKDQLRSISKEAFLGLKKYLVKDFLKENSFPEKYDADKVIDLVKSEKIKPAALAEYLDDANTQLFDTEVVGAEVYRSFDGGKTWKKTHDGFLDDLYYSYGYYFGQICVAPQNADHLYIYGVPILKSKDGGKTWKSINEENVHVDHHTLWVNPKREGHLILGNDGGINISYDDGANWIKCNSPSVGQFYHVAVDMASPYNVYGGLQDNGVWYGLHTYEASSGWHGSGHYPYKSILGGDGMQTAIDNRNNITVYTGFQFGNYYRIDKNSSKREKITPQHDLGERPLRWNWQTPIHLSEHNQDILYMGSNKLHRSFNQGKDWTTISPDLTKGGQKGDVPFGTLTTIHESPTKFGLIYTGSDDGQVFVTPDGGNTWTNITTGLPENLWISRVQASKFEQGRVYVSLNGYRWDDMRSFVYVSENYGKTWQRLGLDLPLEPVNVVKEDPKNPNLLYVGTDHALYISLDRGKSFMQMNDPTSDQGLPAVAVHDLVVHTKENDLIVGTHGRSIYLANVGHVQQLVDSIINKVLYAFEIEKVRQRSSWGNPFSAWSEEDPEPDIEFPVYAREGNGIKITLKSGDLVLKTWQTNVKKGLNYLTYHGDFDESAVEKYALQLNEKKQDDEKAIEVKKAKNGKYYLQKGSYTVVFEKGETKMERKLTIGD